MLLGVTGSGKTFTMANVISAVKRPALVIAHNKTLAAQLYGEFKELFPTAAVHYFVSYYDYYQPEAYVPSTDTYIEKDSSINDEIDRMRHAATHALLTRNDVIIVASVSCIYGLGTAEAYFGLLQQLEKGQEFLRDRFIRSLVDIQYERNDIDFHRGTFRVRGDTVEVFPPYEEARAIRIEFFGDVVERIQRVRPAARAWRSPSSTRWPSSPTATTSRRPRPATAPSRASATSCSAGSQELRGAEQARRGAAARAAHHVRPGDAGADGLLHRHRELLALALGAEGRASRRPACSTTSPRTSCSSSTSRTRPCRQIGAMYRGDRARKETLVEYGFRLPSALDNRPLKFEEFEAHVRAGHLRLGHARPTTSCEKARRRGGGADHPPHRARRPGGGGPAGRAPRSTTCSARSASAPRPASGCWSPRSPSGWPRT